MKVKAMFDPSNTDVNAKLNKMINEVGKLRNSLQIQTSYLKENRYFKKKSQIKQERIRHKRNLVKHKK